MTDQQREIGHFAFKLDEFLSEFDEDTQERILQYALDHVLPKLKKSALTQPQAQQAKTCHDSDCAVNNAPALPVGPCDCGFEVQQAATPTIEDINLQDWAGLDPAVAFHLIERHADDWAHAGRLMEAWRLAQSVLPLSAWLPINSAPKDGSLFLCWVEAVRYGETEEGQQYQQDVSQIDFCQWRTQADIPDCGWFDPCCGQIGDQQGVTHWQPLPAPPITAHGAGGESGT